MQVLYATSYLAAILDIKCRQSSSVSGKEREGKVQELKRCKKVSKAFQIAKGLVNKNWIPAGRDGFQHVSVRFPGGRSQSPNEQIMKPSALGIIFVLLHSVIMISSWLIRT